MSMAENGWTMTTLEKFLSETPIVNGHLDLAVWVAD
jgi:hypothetical protein